MRTRYLALLLFVVFVCGCAATADIEGMFRDFDDYENDLRAVTMDPQAIDILEAGKTKRVEAAALADRGKKREAVPMIERALADVELALELDKMSAAEGHAEKCRMAAEQARVKWLQALHALNQTEEFVGKKASISMPQAEPQREAPAMPASTLMPDSFPPAAMEAVSGQWRAWRQEASALQIAVPDLDSAFRRHNALVQAEKATEEAVDQGTYLAARTVQKLECRARTRAYEQECVEAAGLTAEFSDARDEALRTTLDLERSLQDDLRRELDQFRAEAETRQDELYNALRQMEGKFASIRRDARGTIVSLADILFDFDKATLRREVEFNLVKIATILNQFAEMNILIEGHTDSIGSDEYNLGLSQRRAKAVFDFMISQGVEEGRMSWEGYGETRPVADNSTDEGRQRNRRVDLVIQDAR
jgi:outer membrane protein OmpA-like peptidoglycan-associated protein